MKKLIHMYITLFSAFCIFVMMILMFFDWLIYDNTPVWLPVIFDISLFAMIIIPVFKLSSNTKYTNKEEK
jgi:hypothetical protein